MESIATLLEEELSGAVEVKDSKSLHRYILLLTQHLVERRQYEEEHGGLRSDIKEMITVMRERFDAMDKRFEAVDKRFDDMQKSMDKRFEDMQKSMDKRFEAVDKRFDDVNKRFGQLTALISIGFVVINLMIVLFKIL